MSAGPDLRAAPSLSDALERCRGLVTPALRAAVRRLTPPVGRVAEFTLGWRDVDGTPRAGSGGKGLRPALTVLSAQAVGAAPESAIAGAVAVELIHAFSLVHDDIMDGDERRRHRAAVWKAYGVGPAVLAGDALLALALDALAGAAPGETGSAAMAAISATLVELVNGQAEDMSFEARPWTGPRAVTVAEYSAMAGRKTGSLLGCAAGIGALLGGASADVVAALTRMGCHLGLAFQAVDDMLGIWGEPTVTGKPVFSDLRQRKKTLPVVSALASGTPSAGRLVGLLGTDATAPSTEERLRDVAEMISAAGGRSFTSASAERHLRWAQEIISAVTVDRTAAAALTELSERAVHRSY
jgi:geranylgeranyl diphosphate synthase type I